MERKLRESKRWQATAQLALLNDISGKVAAGLELDSVLDRAVRLVQESLGYHHVALFTVDHEQGELVMKARAGDFTTLFPPDHRLKLDQGMVGWVGRHGERLLANDVSAEPRYVNLFPDAIPTRSELSVPIQVNGEIVGVLDVQSPHLNAFDENDVMVIETLASQIAVAIENSLYKAAQRELAERKQTQEALRVSHHFLEIANHHTEIVPLLEEFVAEARTLTGCAAVGIRILDEEGNIPYQAYQGFRQSFYESESPLSIKSNQCMCINVIKGEVDPNLLFYTEGGSFYMNGTTRFLATVSEEKKGQTRNVCNQFGYESVALVPIRVEDRLFGLIHVADPQENMVPLEMVEMLEEVAIQLGANLQRIRAEEALRRYADEQAALYAVTSAVATSLDPGELLSIILEVVLLVLDSDVGWVTMPGPTLDDPPRVVAWRGVPESFVAAEMAVPMRNCPICASLLADGDAHTEPQLIVGCLRLPPEVLASANLHNHVCIPLSAGSKVMGILDVAWRAPRPCTESDRALLMAIGRQVGMALHNAQLYQAARQVDRLRVLNELDQALAATLDPETMAEVTLHQTAVALDAPMGALFVLPSQAGAHHVRAFTLERGWIRVESSEEDMRHLRPLLRRLQDGCEIISPSGDNLAAIGGQPDLAQRWGPNGLVVPIRSDGRLVAVLVLGGRPVDRPFTDEDRALAQTVASRAGQAIQNARLYQETVWRLNEAETLGAVTTALTRSLDLDQVLQSIVDSATRLIPASTSGVIHLVDETAEKLIPQATSPGVNIQKSMEMPIGKGIAGLVMQEKRPINVPNVEEDPRFLPLDTATPHKSLLTAPLLIDGECIGTLSLNSDQVGAFSADDERLLMTLAAQAAVAVRNARLHREVQYRVEELVFLNRVGRTVTSSLNMEQVLTTVMQEATDVLKVEAVSVLLLDDEGKELAFETVVGSQAEKVKGLRLPLGQGIAGWVARESQPLLVPDVREDPRFYPGIDEATGFVTKSVLAVPLKVKGKVLGVIEAVNKTEGYFSQADVALLSSMAQPAVIAIENARLFEKVMQQREQLRALAARLAEVEEAERQRLAQELHDRVGQNLTVLGINLNIVRAQMPGEAADLVRSHLNDSLVLVEQTTECIRDVMADLRPPVLDDYGLVTALRWYGTQFTSRTGIAVTVQGEEPASRLSTPVENALFRIAQEALTNVAKHAQATQVTVSVEMDNGTVCLVVTDDGIGFDPARLAGSDGRQGWGLITMTERAEAVGGCCRIESGPRQGTQVVVEVAR